MSESSVQDVIKAVLINSQLVRAWHLYTHATSLLRHTIARSFRCELEVDSEVLGSQTSDFDNDLPTHHNRGRGCHREDQRFVQTQEWLARV